MNPVTFLRETYDELKKVVWPTQKEITRLTIVVIAISIIVGLFIGALDLVLVQLLKLVAK